MPLIAGKIIDIAIAYDKRATQLENCNTLNSKINLIWGFQGFGWTLIYLGRLMLILFLIKGQNGCTCQVVKNYS